MTELTKEQIDKMIAASTARPVYRPHLVKADEGDWIISAILSPPTQPEMPLDMQVLEDITIQ